jgi:translation initiation factor 1 (eIF-1/SUI1)
MHRHGHDNVKILALRRRPQKQPAERSRQTLDLAILEELDQLLQCAFVGAQSVSEIEIQRAVAAGRAFPVAIQGVSTQERRPANLAEKLRFNRER